MLSKKGEIAALDKFIKTLLHGSGDRENQEARAAALETYTYFTQFVVMRDRMTRNIQDDIPAFSGVFVAQKEHDAVLRERETANDAQKKRIQKFEAQLAGLHALARKLNADHDEEVDVLRSRIDDLSAYDVRLLNAAKEHAEEAVNEAKQDLFRINEELQAI